MLASAPDRARSAGQDRVSTANGPEVTDSPQNAISAEGLTFTYPGGDAVLDNISFKLPKGGLTAVIGPNGGGKSTLLRLILGLLRPDRGRLSVFGRPPEAMRGHIGYVPQFSALQPDFPISVLEMTLMGAARPSARGAFWSTDHKARQKALGYLEVLGIGDCARLPVGDLSGGQRQRAMVARALMSAPDDLSSPAGSQNSRDNQDSGQGRDFLLLLDEPTASIDPEGKFCFYEFLGQLRGRISILVVSHDLFLISPFFDAVLFVNKSLTPLEHPALTPEIVSSLFGSHRHDCPVGDIQHAGGLTHSKDCTHPACRSELEDQQP